MTLKPISPNFHGMFTNIDPVKRMKSRFGSRVCRRSLIHGEPADAGSFTQLFQLPMRVVKLETKQETRIIFGISK